MRAVYKLSDIVADGEVILRLEPEEFAPFLLEFLNAVDGDINTRGALNRYNIGLPDYVENYPQHLRTRISRAIMEAWMFLEREGFVAPEPGNSGDWYFVTRRGKQLKDRVDFSAFQKRSLLPRGTLHPAIAEKVWATYLRGDYDTAVFQAFKEVEVAVREAGAFKATDIGVQLMRDAFHPDSGPLTDAALPTAERQAVSQLFAGAIGVYKNSSSHRDLGLEDAESVAEIIAFASHLLRIVDMAVRRKKKGGSASA